MDSNEVKLMIKIPVNSMSILILGSLDAADVANSMRFAVAPCSNFFMVPLRLKPQL